jgi:large subunit ribosomal protein L23
LNSYEVIRRPLLTEKTTDLKELRRTLCFEVAVDATKVEIRRAVEKLLGVRVQGVRTARMSGKLKRQGRFSGKRPDWKKAFVTVKEGEKMVEYFEGV